MRGADGRFSLWLQPPGRAGWRRQPHRKAAPLRLLFATAHPYPPQARGGTEASTHELCLALGGAGHDCAVLARLYRHDRFGRGRVLLRLLSAGRRGAEDRLPGYPVHRWRRPERAAAGTARRFAPDIALVQAGLPLPLAERLDHAGVATMIHVRDLFALPEVAPRLKRMARIGLIANSRFSAACAEANGLAVAGVVPPIVLPERYRVATTRERVLFVNPQPGKGLDIALALAEARPDIPFDFVESWSFAPAARDAAAAQAARLANVTWSKARADIRPLLARTRLVLAPSRWSEGWGRIVSEAQVSGIPALASDRGGLPEAVGPGGILRDPDGDPRLWVEALAALWKDGPLYQGLAQAAAAHAARPAFQPGALAAHLIALVEAHRAAIGARAGAHSRQAMH